MSGEEGIDGKLICLEIKYIVGTVEADCLIVRQENKKKALDLALDFWEQLIFIVENHIRWQKNIQYNLKIESFFRI